MPAPVQAVRAAYAQARVEQHLCVDAGYDYEAVRETVNEWGYTLHLRRRRDEQAEKVAGHRARRWVVARSHSWFNRFRYLLVRWSKKAANYLALLHFACALITWKRCLLG